MSEIPNFEAYSYLELLDANRNINAEQYPGNKAIVERLLEERKSSEEYKKLLEERKAYIEKTKYATFWRRLGASILDWIILIVSSLLLGMIFNGFIQVPEKSGSFFEHLFYYSYFIFMHGFFGATIGKYLLRIKVVNFENERPINFEQAYLRDCVPIFLISGALLIDGFWESNELFDFVSLVKLGIGVLFILWPISEFVTMLFNEKRRAIHDYIAGTVVIREYD